MANERPIPIDYTNLGYESLRDAMLALARESLPEWTDFSESDLGVLLVELFAYANDITLYYQTRIAANLFPATSDEPEALVQLLRLIGYELRPPAAATAMLQLAFEATQTLPFTVPAGTKFFATASGGEPVTFETERAFVVQGAQLTPPDSRNLRHLLLPVPVAEGVTEADAPVAVSDGSPNQLYALRKRPVVPGSIRLAVLELPTVESFWQEVETLAGSSPADQHFVVERDAEGRVHVLFGDGLNGRIPPRGSEIRARYRVGGGPKGNVPAGTEFRPSLTAIRRAVNPQAAAGGTDREDVERARLRAPRLFRTQARAVTAQDYVDHALLAPGVGKARAVSLSWNQVVLYVAPSGRVAAPSETLKRDLLAYFEGRRMVTTSLKIVGPKPADIYLGAVIRAKPFYLRSDVRAAVEAAVADYLAFEAVDFGQPIYLSKIYDVIQSLDYVASLTVFKFSRSPTPLPGAAAATDVETDGIIELAPHELPRPGYRDNPEVAVNPADPSYRTPIFTIIEGGAEG